MINYLGKVVDVIINRPFGTKHPEHGFVYPVNYGYITGRLDGDAAMIEAYILGEFEPMDTFNGRVIAIIKRKNANEDKLVIAKTLNSYSEEQIYALTEFQERFFDIEIVCCSGRTEKPSIRPLVLGLARRDNEILVEEGFDIIKNQTFYRALGGGIEFGEKSRDSLKREFKEELGIDIVVKERICTVDNLFTFEKRMGHEIVSIYNIELPEEDYKKNEFKKIEENAIGKAFWINKNEFLEGKKILYPEEIKEYL